MILADICYWTVTIIAILLCCGQGTVELTRFGIVNYFVRLIIAAGYFTVLLIGWNQLRYNIVGYYQFGFFVGGIVLLFSIAIKNDIFQPNSIEETLSALIFTAFGILFWAQFLVMGIHYCLPSSEEKL